jgi:ribosome assembly protein YihI (activator of Der GTPase)
MPNNQMVSNNRERYLERLKSKNSGKEFADDEAIFGQANADYDNYEQELSGYREREQALTDLFASNPQSAAFLTDWRNGEDPLIGMVRKFGDDFKAALEDPEKQEALAAANKDFAERIAQEEKYEAEYQRNIQSTLDTLNTLQDEEGLSDDDIDQAMEFLVKIVRDGIMGTFSIESVKMALKALHHDEDVKLSEMEGEVRGRNAKIEEKLRKGRRSDGTANLSSKNSAGFSKPQSMPDLGAIDRNYGENDIWKRGGEKRKPYK